MVSPLFCFTSDWLTIVAEETTRHGLRHKFWDEEDEFEQDRLEGYTKRLLNVVDVCGGLRVEDQ